MVLTEKAAAAWASRHLYRVAASREPPDRGTLDQREYHLRDERYPFSAFRLAAHRFFCASLIFFRAAADIWRRRLRYPRC